MSTGQKLRVVMVGCGGRAQEHIAALLECGAVELLALCDLDEKKLKDTGARFKVPKLYTKMEEAIQLEKPELVDICTPPTIRSRIVEPAIQAGAPHVLIEKPIALEPQTARQLLELGRNRLIAVNTQCQWMPHWQRFWEMLRERAFGEILRIYCGSASNILEQGPHVLDLALKATRLSGLPDPDWVLANCFGLERYGTTPVPADTSATIGVGDARIHLNQGPSARRTPGEKCFWFHKTVDIQCAKGRIYVTLGQGWTYWLDGKSESGPTSWEKDNPAAQRALYANLRDAIHTGAWNEFPTRIQVAAQVSDVMFACYASACGGGRVKLPTEFPAAVVDRLEMLPK
ncbi:MAG: Gfo/Idh/MocA family oxidoreductase [Planctomycetota bacterium]